MSNSAAIIPRSDHNISRDDISDNALKVLYRLHQSGYQAYLVGGCVRDLLLELHPKDFDVVTDAHPEEIKRIFDNCRLIGRRFRLAHILFGRDVVEVATFRGPLQEADFEDGGNHLRHHAESGRIMRDNVYGTLEEDVWRRDFTMNALYYNIADFTLVDHVGALADIRRGVIRLIGDPETRYREDPVRMLRALRFAAKLSFEIAKDAAAPIQKLGHLLHDIPPARLFDETLKMFHGGCAVKTFHLLREFGLFRHLFPAAGDCLEHQSYAFSGKFIEHALTSTDARIVGGKPVTPAFLFATFLWLPLLRKLGYEVGGSFPGVMDMQKAGSALLQEQGRVIAMPRRYAMVVRDIWALQPRLQRYAGKRTLLLLQHPRFRAAYDFLCLRAEAGEDVQEQAQWWTEIQTHDPAGQRRMIDSVLPKTQKKPGVKAGNRSRRRRRNRKSPPRTRTAMDSH
ncbi:MAG TPA: polynucleotide adenylyltransferase PcnB [Gammaproteobacteria bacterium]